MAQPANTHSQYDTVGNREDLSDIIANISPMDFPFWTAIGTGKPATNVRTEWQTDDLRAAASNAVIEGDDVTMNAAVATKRLSNVCQISDEAVTVTGTADAISKAGRDEELAYQVTKKTKELKRDIEFTICQNQAIQIGNDATARTLAGFETWIQTNQSRGAGGAAVAATNEQPNNAAAPTDGTQRAFTEDLFKDVLAQCWSSGGDPTLAITGVFNKRVASAFTGNASRMMKADERRLVTTVDVYVHDYGQINIVASRFSRDRSVLIVDPEFWEMAWLRPLFMKELAVTGDTEKRQIICEYTIRSKQQKSSGIVADLTTS